MYSNEPKEPKNAQGGLKVQHSMEKMDGATGGKKRERQIVCKRRFWNVIELELGGEERGKRKKRRRELPVLVH